MFVLFLVSLSTLLGEITQSTGKMKVSDGSQSIYSFSLLTLLFGIIFYAVLIIATPATFVFSLASLPTFGLRLILEIFQCLFTAKAIAVAERTTFTMIRLITLPLLLGVDVTLGYSLSLSAIIGTIIIFTSMLGIMLAKSVRTKGSGYVLVTALNAVITISLFKYNTTHYNSVMAEQLVMAIGLCLFLYAMARWVAHERPFHMLRQPVFFSQSALSGMSSVIESLAYAIAPAASIPTSAKRGMSILWSILSGKKYFNEHGTLLKLVAFGMMLLGLILLTQ